VVPKNEAQGIEGRILEYLAENPGAQDTLQGIAEWWLTEREIVRSVVEVEAALDQLVTKNLVNKHKRSDGSIYYSIGKSAP
jgi:hypothetical protein